MNDPHADPAQHVVVIGAGIGGLSAALRLAHAGLSVEVVEAAEAPGGKMRTRDSIAGPVDIGPTVVTLRGVFETLFSDVSARLSDHLTLHRDAILARHFWRDGSRLDLTGDWARDADAIERFAGTKAARQFRRFAARAETLFEAFEGPVMQAAQPDLAALTAHVLRHPGLVPAMAPGLTLAQSLALGFDDPRLRQLFGRYATYVGGAPDGSPAVLSLIAHSEACGVWSVEGGIHALARAVHRLAEAKGARFRFGTAATGIARADGLQIVTLADGTTLRAGRVLFNGDPKALRDGLLGEGPRRAVARAGTAPRSLSAYVWGFAAEALGAAPLVHHNVFFCDDPRIEFGDIAAGRPPRDASLYVCAQDRGHGAAPQGPERFEIIMNGPPGRIDNEKDRLSCRTRIFDTLAGMGLRFSPVPNLDCLMTPMDFAAAYPGSDGSLYGRSPRGMSATFARPTARTKMPGLYLCGGGTHPGAGIPMACLSGQHAAAAILSDLASTSTSPGMATPGGMSTGSATMANAPSPSSAS